MSMTIYVNSSDKKVIGKTLETVKTVNYILLEDCSIISPELTLDYDSDILTANYAYILEFNRYYYIDNITILSGARLKLSLSIDVLETYKAEIKELTCIIKRNTRVFNMYLDDPLFQAQNTKQIQTKVFSNTEFTPSVLSGTSSCIVLTVAQGGAE